MCREGKQKEEERVMQKIKIDAFVKTNIILLKIRS